MSGEITYTTVIWQRGNNTAIAVPAEVLKRLNSGKRPKVVVRINGYTYRSTVAVMEGMNLIPFNAAHRKASGVSGGERHEVTLTLDAAPRTVEVPNDLAAALRQLPAARAFYDTLSYTNRKEITRALTSAKKEETRRRRLAKILDDLQNEVKY